MMKPQARRRGKKLHLLHGPIDVIIEAFGEPREVARAYEAATARFETILEELVAELEFLRSPVSLSPSSFRWSDTENSPIASAMCTAVEPFADKFITPMASVAGAVADELLHTMRAAAGLKKAYANNGGDIALYLAPNSDEIFSVGVVADPRMARLVTTATIGPHHKIGGIATSGRHGRSHCLGIADAVTVFAADAATADAAATMIANAVDLPDCAQISRIPANELSPDSDLKDHLVTTNVATLSATQIAHALAVGENLATQLIAENLISAAFLSLQETDKIIDKSIDPVAPYASHSCLQNQQDGIAHA